MAKLIIPSLPVFSTFLPSNGKQVTFRPITVKEESILLLAKESEKQEDVFTAIASIVKECVDYPFKKLKLIDLEWLFLQIRIRSVSEEVELNYRCLNVLESGKKCGAAITNVVDLNKVEIVGEQKSSVELSFKEGTFKINFIHPSITESKDEISALYSMVESIVNPSGEVITKDDITKDEFMSFVETFTNAQLEKMKLEISKLSKMHLENEIVCPVCGNTNKVTYSSLSDFFT